MDFDNYIKEQNLTNSFIDKKFLYQVRPTLPEKKYVGITKNGARIYFEETQGSLRNRHYRYKNKVTSWNLIYIDNDSAAKKVDEKWLEGQIINFYSEYDRVILINFLRTNTKRFNALDNSKSKKKQRSIWLTDDEYDYVLTFVEKMRRVKGEKQ